MSSKRCYYEVLGVPRGASQEEIRRAFKKEALRHHPDRNKGDPAAELRFKEVNEAFQVLSCEKKRAVYDQLGHAGLEGGASMESDLGDVFSHMQDLFAEMFAGVGPFGGRSRGARRGQDLRVQVRLSLREAILGARRDVTVEAPSRCRECGGNGARAGTAPEVCGACRGSGQVSSSRGFVMFTAPCGRCQGRGYTIKDPCPCCNARGVVAERRTVTVVIPAGIDQGQRLRVQGQGVAVPGAAPGDLYVEVDVEEDPRFERDGTDLITRVGLSFRDAVLGADVDVPCIAEDENATVKLTIPPGTASATVFTLRGHGAPRVDGRGRGNLQVLVHVEVPRTVTPEARRLLEALDAELRRGASQAPGKRAAAGNR